MSDIVLSVENLWKQYRLGLVGSGTLRDDVARWIAKLRGKEDPTLKIGAANTLNEVAGDYVWALQDINFEVKQGEVLGIIGKNGAGKSTLLKILSKVTAPTKGQVKVKGRIASLLEVGTGFHPELTGRENIFLNGAILGMNKAEIRRKLDEIIDFAGVAKYVDTPVKRYSSGMRVRLGFAVAAFLEPEILVVDEVLAVGDAEFQKKAVGKMQAVSKSEGRTVLFVSHNMGAVQNLCSRALVLQQGRKYYEGDTQEGVSKYLSINIQNNKNGRVFIPQKNPSEEKTLNFLEVVILNDKEEVCYEHTYDNPIKIRMKYHVLSKKNAFVLLLRLNNAFGETIFTSWDSDYGDMRIESSNQTYEAECIIPHHLLKTGEYFVSIAAHIPKVEVIEYYENIISFEISILDYKANLNRLGVILPKLAWSIKQTEEI